VGLHTKRNQILFGANVEYVAALNLAANPSDQLLADLAAMNEVGAIIGGSEALPASTQQERILFISDLLPFGFLAGAARVGKSVARLTVPRFEAGKARLQASGDPILFYGTGWLIGPKHVITNYHVVNARYDEEAPAEPSDLEVQARGSTVEFDYDHDNVPGEKFAAIELCAVNTQLDYAILEMDREPGRAPLPLWGRAIDFSAGSMLPVNIIQHPGGAPKQMAIRNNLTAALRGSDLAYYTDTNAGSSGSPCVMTGGRC
jgi:endonuclease G